MTLRRAGARWRILAHTVAGRHYSDAWHVASTPELAGGDSDDPPVDVDGERYQTHRTILADTEIDEVVIGRWLHLEQMDVGVWWINVAGVVIHVRADRDGRPTRVTVAAPGDDDDPVPGCEYRMPGD